MSTNVEQHNIQLYWKVKSNQVNTTKCTKNPWPNPTQAIRVSSKYFPTCPMCIALPWQDKILQHQELPKQCHNEHCSDNQRVPDNEEKKRSISNKKKRSNLNSFSSLILFVSSYINIALFCYLLLRNVNCLSEDLLLCTLSLSTQASGCIFSMLFSTNFLWW